jgi:hypothetical protein
MVGFYACADGFANPRATPADAKQTTDSAAHMAEDSRAYFNPFNWKIRDPMPRQVSFRRLSAPSEVVWRRWIEGNRIFTGAVQVARDKSTEATDFAREFF